MEELLTIPGTKLKVIQCGTCGVWHAIPLTMFDSCYEEGGFWHCPNGHQRGYTEGSLHKQLEKEKKRRMWAEENAKRMSKEADHQKSRANGFKSALTKVKKRASAGVCPCCNRTFKQLAKHMKMKHPEYGE